MLHIPRAACCRWLMAWWAVSVEGLCAQSATLYVRSAQTDAPIVNALVVWHTDRQGMQQAWTAANGSIQFSLHQPVRFQVFHSGYQMHSDSLAPGQHRIIRLQPIAVDLGEVVVTGQHRLTLLAGSVLPVRVLNRDEIEQRQAQDLSDVVAYELWARMSRDEVLGSNASINGISGQNIKVLLNGLPVTGRENGHIDLGQITLNDVERIEIIEGPLSVLYGTDALGGVINIITQHPPDSGRSANLQLYTETVGTYNIAASGQGQFGGHAFLISGGRNFFSGFPDSDQQRHQLWKPELQYFGSVAYQPQLPNWTVGLRSGFFYEEIRNKGEPVITPYQAYAFDDFYYVRRLSQTAQVSRTFSGQRNWELQAGYNFYSRKKAAYRKDLVTLTQQEREGEAQLNTLGEWSVRSTLSGMLWQQQLSWQAGIDLNGQQATGDRLLGDRKQQSDLAVFGTLEYQATPSLSLRPGLRLAHNAYGVPLTPALNLRYDFSEHIHLRAGLARGFRAPSLKERYLNFYDSNHSIYGNPELKAEQSFSANMFWLFEYVMGAVQLNSEVAVAYNDISNQINLSLVNALEQEYTYINVGQYRTRTATVQTEAHWNSLRLQAGFMLQAISHSLNDTLATDGYVIAPEYRFQIMAGQPDRNLRVALLFRRTAPMPAFSTDAAGVVYEKIAPAYNLLDVTLSRSLWQQRLSLHAGINNILNVKDVPNLSSSTAIHSSQDAIPVAVGRYAFLGIKLNVIGP